VHRWTRDKGWWGLRDILGSSDPRFSNSTGRFRCTEFIGDYLPPTGWMSQADKDKMQSDLDTYGIDFIVWSFYTPIAWRRLDGTWFCPDAGYSQRTKSCHLSPLRPALHAINESVGVRTPAD
jgi:hypothetical protein